MIRESDFKPAWWLPNPHLQTIWPYVFKRNIRVGTQCERFELPDGDFVDLVWVGNTENKNRPIVIVLHGLTGSIESPYAPGILHAIAEKGWRGLFMHFRGCSGIPNRLPRYYHAGDTSDVELVVSTIHRRYPHAPLVAIGYSLGGNVLLKWLGETQNNNPLAAAIAVSVPFELHIAAQRVNQGFSQIYKRAFLRDLRKLLIEKSKVTTLPFEEKLLFEVNDFVKFDSLITAPLHGFKDAHDYYTQASCRPYLKYIQKPTLIIHSKDDPLLSKEINFSERELSSCITLELSEKGGHVGFIKGYVPFHPVYWLEEKIPSFLAEALKIN
jgi:uncharacterized protein